MRWGKVIKGCHFETKNDLTRNLFWLMVGISHGISAPISCWGGSPVRNDILHFYLYINSRGEVEVGEGVDGFVGGIEDVDETFVGEDLVMVAGVFVCMG